MVESLNEAIRKRRIHQTMAVTEEISKIADIGKQKMIKGLALISSNAMFAKKLATQVKNIVISSQRAIN